MICRIHLENKTTRIQIPTNNIRSQRDHFVQVEMSVKEGNGEQTLLQLQNKHENPIGQPNTEQRFHFTETCQSSFLLLTENFDKLQTSWVIVLFVLFILLNLKYLNVSPSREFFTQKGIYTDNNVRFDSFSFVLGYQMQFFGFKKFVVFLKSVTGKILNEND